MGGSAKSGVIRTGYLYADDWPKPTTRAKSINECAIAAALSDVAYDGPVVIESFTPEVKSIARAVCIWRELAGSQDELAREGLAFLRGLFG